MQGDVNYRDHLIKLNNVFMLLTDKLALHRNEFKNEFYHIEPLCLKFGLQIHSLLNLCNGNIIEYIDKTKKIPDISSIYIISRAIIENYLVIDYLYFIELDDDQSKLRHNLYNYAGLRNRQNFIVSNEINKQKKEAERILMNEYLDKIKSTDYYKNLETPSQKKNLVKNAKLYKWVELIEKSKLNTLLFKDIWSLFSNWAHSESLSTMQLNSAIGNPKFFTESIELIYRNNSIILTVLINELSQRFTHLDVHLKELKNKYPNLEEALIAYSKLNKQ